MGDQGDRKMSRLSDFDSRFQQIKSFAKVYFYFIDIVVGIFLNSTLQHMTGTYVEGSKRNTLA